MSPDDLTREEVALVVRAVAGGLVDDYVAEYLRGIRDFTPWWGRVNERISGLLGRPVVAFSEELTSRRRRRMMDIYKAVGFRSDALEVRR